MNVSGTSEPPIQPYPVLLSVILLWVQPKASNYIQHSPRLMVVNPIQILLQIGWSWLLLPAFNHSSLLLDMSSANLVTSGLQPQTEAASAR